MLYYKIMSDTKDPKNVNIEDMTCEQSLDAIWNMVNKAATKGAFNIDESYVLKILFTKVLKEIKDKDSA